MKKLTILSIILMLAFAVNNSNCFAQSYQLSGTTFKSVKGKSTRSPKDTLVTKFTFETTTGTYPIIINKASGSCYYYCKKKDGSLYRRYCPTEVSAQVAKALGIEYKNNKKK